MKRGLACQLACGTLCIIVNLTPSQAIDLDDVRRKFETAEQAILAQDYKRAESLLYSVERHDPYSRIYGAFIEGRIAEATGRLTTARDIYRAILNEHPDLARVRLHLARTLAALEDVEASRYHFDMLLGAGIETGIAEKIRTDRQALDRLKRWTASAYFTIAPTTNVTSGPSQNSFDLSGLSFTPAETAKKRSGVGALYGAEAAWLTPLTDNWGAIATISTAQRDYKASDFDDRVASASAGLRYLLPAGLITPEIVAQRRWYGGVPYQYGVGPRITWRSMIGTHHRVTATASIMMQKYDEVTYQNGHRSSFMASWDLFTWPGQFLRIGAAADSERTRSTHLDYRETSLFLGYNFDMPFALTAYPEVSVAWRPHKGDFPFMTSPRSDRRRSGSLTLVKKDLTMFGFAPRLQVTWLRNTSNVGLYTYNKLEGALTLTREY